MLLLVLVEILVVAVAQTIGCGLQERVEILKYVCRVHFVVELVGEQYLEYEHAKDEHGEKEGVGALLALLRVHLMVVLPHYVVVVSGHDYGEYDDVE